MDNLSKIDFDDLIGMFNLAPLLIGQLGLHNIRDLVKNFYYEEFKEDPTPEEIEIIIETVTELNPKLKKICHGN